MIAWKDKISILHIEDNPDDIELVKMILKKSGLKVELTGVPNKEEFESTDLNNFDLVFVDYNLNDYNGLSALKWVRKYYDHKPVIIVSGTVGEELAVDLLHAGAQDFVLKTNLKKLPISVQRAMSEHRIINEKTRFQTELLHKNLILDTIFEGFPHPIYLKDEERKYIKVNRAFCNLHEISESEVLGKKDEQILPEKNFERSLEDDNLIYSTGRISTYETEYISKSGRRQILEIVKAPILTEGKVTGIVGEAHDITEKNEILHRIEKSQYILNQAEQITLSGSFEYDADLDILTCSSNLLKMLNLRVDENKISLNKLAKLVKKEDRELFTSELRAAIENRKECFMHQRYIKADNHFGNFKLLLKPDFKDDTGHRFYGTILDITSEQEQAVIQMVQQEEDRKEIALELHDNLGQKMNAIAMFTSKMADDHPKDKSMSKVRDLTREAIDDLSSIMSNISVKHVEEHSLEFALTRLTESLPSSMEVDFNYMVEESKVSNFTKTQVYRIGQELLNNILKYSEAKCVQINLSLDGSILNFLVEDNGKGFNLEANSGGHGLNNITHRVKRSNGLVDFYSQEGKGTRVTIKMPTS